MYEYDYVTIRTGGGFWMDNSTCGHRNIIDKRAAEGWRFVGCVPTEFTSNGGTKALDLVFERLVNQ